MITICWFYHFYWKEINTVFQRNVCTLMFIDAFLTIDTIGKQPECSLVLERIKKYLTHIQNGILFRCKKRRISCHWWQYGWTSRTPKWNKSDREIQALDDIPHASNLKMSIFSSCSLIQSISKELEHIFDLSCQWKQIFI